MEKISIIVPVYNVEKYLERCLDSIINQTYKNLEIIIVNDGSPDNSGLICEQYKNKDSRIKVVHKDNGGLADARNVGLDIATGKYIGFVDSDDFIAHDMYEFLYGLIVKYNADISICGFTRFENEPDIRGNKVKEYLYTSKTALRELMKVKKFHSHACDKLFKAELFDGIRFPKGKHYEDVFTTYKLFDKANKIIFNSTYKYFYRLTEGSISNSTFNIKDLDLIEASEELIKFTKEKYPDIVNIQIRAYVRHNISILRKMIIVDYKDSFIIDELRSNIKRNLINYLLSDYKLSSKCFGLIVAMNFSLARKIYNSIF